MHIDMGITSDRAIERHYKCDRNGKPDLVIEGGTIVTVKDDMPVIKNGRVEISGRSISRILSHEERMACPTDCSDVIVADGTIVMPGLVNCHTHSAMTLFRGMADDLPLKKWLFEKIFPAEATFLSPETAYLGSLLACIEMLASGTTCFMDGYFFEDSLAHAALETGIRVIAGQGVIDFPAPGIPDPSANILVAREFAEKWSGFSDLIKPAIFCHSPVTCSGKTLSYACETCRVLGIPLFIHLSETRLEVEEVIRKSGKRPAHYLDSLGILDENLVAVHNVYLDESEIDLLASKGVRTVHAPESNMKLASGMAPISKMISRGLRPGLGTDGCASNNNLDMFGEMDTAAKAAKIQAGDPTVMSSKTLLKMVTSWGSAVGGLNGQIGTIEVGKEADVIIVDAKKPHMRPLYDPISSLVYCAGGSDVRDVIVAGKILMKDRKFLAIEPSDIIKEIKRLGGLIEKSLLQAQVAGI